MRVRRISSAQLAVAYRTFAQYAVTTGHLDIDMAVEALPDGEQALVLTSKDNVLKLYADGTPVNEPDGWEEPEEELPVPGQGA